ncbi:hypothetical protein [Parvularcula oceani]|uniref:hypothetical protein n=1 Tax=Parvularcula oceani TaxID=1247963 RepID=UPI0004E251A3|nr:hypothetical protein [Parvularcula oceani]
MKKFLHCAPIALIALGTAAAQDWVLPLNAASDLPPSGEAVTALAFDVQTRFGEAATATSTTSRLRIGTPEGLQVGDISLG